MCTCAQRKPMLGSLSWEYCVDCGRIWIITLFNTVIPTERFHPIQKTTWRRLDRSHFYHGQQFSKALRR